MTHNASESELPPCEYARLVQLYVDQELGTEEVKSAADHVAVCPTCLAVVAEQQRVRAALKGLRSEPMPEHLRARVLLALDEVDKEIDVGNNVVQLGAGGRIRAFFGGSLIFAPAAAVAAGLFFAVRVTPAVPESVGDDAQLVAKAVVHDGALAQVAVPRVASSSDSVEIDRPFQLQLADDAALPSDVALLSANRAPADAGRSGTVRYENRTEGLRFVDRQRFRQGVAPQGRPQSFSGRTYHLRRASDGSAIVQFEVGGVLHTLTLEHPKTVRKLAAGPGQREARLNVGAVDLSAPDFRALVQFANAISRNRP